jgi:hypothetical protein
LKFTITLQERSNIDYIVNFTIISNYSNLINNNEKAIPKHFSLPNNIHTMNHNNINNSNIQDNLIRNTENNLQEFNFTIYFTI